MLGMAQKNWQILCTIAFSGRHSQKHQWHLRFTAELEFFNVSRNVTEEIVFADDNVLIFSGFGDLGAWLTYCKFEGGKAVDMRHARGQRPD